MENYNTEKEVWKDVVGYEGYYQVSNLGRVKSVDRYIEHYRGGKTFKKGKIKALNVRKDGYVSVQLSKDAKARTLRVHRLVAEAFIPNPNNLPQVNHKDENKGNNHVSNLEWCTVGYNVNYGTRIKRIKEKEDFNIVNIKNRKRVARYSLDGEFIEEFNSMTEVEKKLGFHRPNISKCCNGHINSVYDSIWVFRSENEKKEVQERIKRIAEFYRPVIMRDKNGFYIKEYPSITDASNELGINTGRICECCQGKRKTYKGYIFEYADEVTQ